MISSSSTAPLLFPRRETLFEQVSRALSNLIHAGRWKPLLGLETPLKIMNTLHGGRHG